MEKNVAITGSTITIFRIIFYCCSFYFLLMGLSLIFIPELLVQSTSGGNVSPTIIGMLRGAGGSVLPYSLLYILIVRNPISRLWAMWVIVTANIIAIFLDFGSVFLDEYKLSYAMLDVPVEVLSLIGILIIWIKIRSIRKVISPI